MSNLLIAPSVRSADFGRLAGDVRAVDRAGADWIPVDSMDGRRLAEHAGVPEDAILFMGDAIYPGGNDDPVRAAGIDTVAVRDVLETGNVIRGIIACMKHS